jgi:transcription antitermination factor NusG
MGGIRKTRCRCGGAMDLCRLHHPWKGLIVYTYCLFCETAKCRGISEEIMERLHCRAISPKLVQHTWSKGKAVDIVHDLLPGYVFVYAEKAPLDVALLRSIEGVIRCLCDGNKQFELSGSDEQFAMMILQKDGVIGKTKVYREGQMIRICQGAYEGLETKILKVKSRNMRMKIEIPFANMKICTWVEYEVVSDREAE